MKISEIIEKCNKAIPREVEYSKGEPYGAHNIPSLDMEVEKILYCVTPTKEVVSHFHENGYDLLISHHPFVAGVPQLIYHTALDCCEGGLNDMWADAIGLDGSKRHFDEQLGWYGDLEEPMYFSDLLNKVRAFAGDIDGQVKSQGDMIVHSVVLCSGLGGMVNHLAEKTKADCYILGEATQPAHQMDFPAVIEIGHTNSEWQGVHFFKELFENDPVEVDWTPKDIDYFGKEFYQERRYKSDDTAMLTPVKILKDQYEADFGSPSDNTDETWIWEPDVDDAGCEWDS